MAGAAESQYRRILGIRFFTGSAAEAVRIGLAGGLVVAPAAPALVEVEGDKAYREALLDADLVLADSGFMVLLWRLLQRERIRRTSGLEYLKALVAEPIFKKPKAVFWIMPTDSARDKNVAWLKLSGISVTSEDCFVASNYDSKDAIIDAKLLSLIERACPAQIVVALGGGIQEKLGHYIKQNVSYKPGIHCIGAAIGFLSGDQVNIPGWADHFFLGWFLRCVSQPAKFIPRYWKARRLFPLIWKYRGNLPVLREG